MTSGTHKVVNNPNEPSIQKEKPGIKMIYIADSNGNGIEPRKLQRDLPCMKAKRYNLNEMTNSIPHCEEPEKVEEIIFNVGVNDVRLGSNAHDIRHKMFNAQHKYYKKFPNARQHICAIPPTSQINQEVNKELSDLAQATGVNFISAKNLCDPTTKTIIPSMIQPDRLHYTADGIKAFGRQIKRSIWSHNNKVSTKKSNPTPL